MRLLIASADGYVYIYAINPAEGGDCTLLKQHRYLSKSLFSGKFEFTFTHYFSDWMGKRKMVLIFLSLLKFLVMVEVKRKLN